MQQSQIHKKIFIFSASINSSYRLKMISRGCVWIELLKFRSFVGLCIIHWCLRFILLFPFVFSLNAFQIFTTLEPSKQNRNTRFAVISLVWLFFFIISISHFFSTLDSKLNVHGNGCFLTGCALSVQHVHWFQSSE